MTSIENSVSETVLAASDTPRPPAGVPLARRLLFPQVPLSSPLQPVLPDASGELNGELLDLIALALRGYVSPWWTRLSRYDRDLLPRAAAIITAVLQRVGERARTAELAPLLLRDAPALVGQHWADFRAARAKLHTAYASGGPLPLAQMFHQLQPHMAISADGQVDPVYVRQTVDHVLQACLPQEDYGSEAERAIICEIVCKVILVDVLPKLAAPWFIHKLALDALSGGSGAEVRYFLYSTGRL